MITTARFLDRLLSTNLEYFRNNPDEKYEPKPSPPDPTCSHCGGPIYPNGDHRPHEQGG